MSTKLREIRRRIGSTRQIHQVTTALQRVSAARLARERRAILNAQRYTQKLVQVLGEIQAGLVVDAPPPLLRARAAVRTVCVVAVGPDRGLCGGLTAELVERVAGFLGERPGVAPRVLVVGQLLSRRLRRRGIEAEAVFGQPARTARAALVDRLAALVTEGFLGGRYDEVHVVYTRFSPQLFQQASVREGVLPARFAAAGPGLRGAGCEPAPEELLAHLLPEYVRQMLDHALLNALGAENAARQVAMTRASHNAAEMITGLVSEYRQLRQESITNEMIELAGGGRQTAG